MRLVIIIGAVLWVGFVHPAPLSALEVLLLLVTGVSALFWLLLTRAR